jgi:ZW10 C-terminal helical domain/Centromere/kinetochore protein zw10, C-terminal
VHRLVALHDKGGGDGGVPIHVVTQCLDDARQFDDAMAWLGDAIGDALRRHVFREDGAMLRALCDGGELCRIVADDVAVSTPTRIDGAASQLECFVDVLRWLRDAVFDGNDALFARFASATLWPTARQCAIERCLKPALPEPSSVDYGRVSSLTERIDASLRALGVADADLSAFLKDVDKHLAERTRATMLRSVQQMLVDYDFDERRIDVDDRDDDDDVDLRLRHSCSVSATAHRFVDELRRWLEARGGDDGASVIEQSVADAASLFLAIVPQRHGKHLRDVARLSLLFANDCELLANCVSTLRAEHRCGDGGRVVHLVPLLRRVSASYVDYQRQEQLRELSEALHSADGLGDAHVAARRALIDSAVERTLYHYSQFVAVWRDVAPPPVAASIAVELLDRIAEHLVAELLLLADIGAEESEALFAALEPLDNALKHLTPPERARLTRWQRFYRARKLLTSRMVAIVDDFVGGGPLSSLFATVEIRHFIEALFADSKTRQTQLSRLSD